MADHRTLLERLYRRSEEAPAEDLSLAHSVSRHLERMASVAVGGCRLHPSTYGLPSAADVLRLLRRPPAVDADQPILRVVCDRVRELVRRHEPRLRLLDGEAVRVDPTRGELLALRIDGRLRLGADDHGAYRCLLVIGDRERWRILQELR